MTGRFGKWPWKNHSPAVTPLSPTIRFASWSYSTIRSTSRNGQRCGIRAWISAVVWMVWVTGSSGWVARLGTLAPSVEGRDRRQRGSACRCASGIGGRAPSSAGRGGKEGGTPHPVEQVGRHPALEERLVEEHRLVD